ncbi:hypothetical protein GHT06_009760 [Daphnia sinensis]|uniref:Uncharacterized protein n=1 Tax=Daphnia sinensis TaxID=1820382 RepID=A0AAD5L4Q6_9CRUS|nr:hypothetical protein GHT06_009760 [Daphnia sinensis]
MKSIILLPLLVAVATAASLYPRNPASTYLLNYPIGYPASYPVQAPFNYGVEARQGGVPLPVLLTQQAVLGLSNFQVQNTVAFWNLVNCLVDSSCPTVTVPPTVTVAAPAAPNRFQTIMQQIMNNPTVSQQNILQNFAQQLSSLLPFPLAPSNSLRRFPVQQYPGSFEEQFL